MVSYVSSSNVNALDRTVDGEALKNWGAVAYTIPTVKYHSRSLTLCVETEHSLCLEENAWGLELFEEQFSSFLPIGERVEWGFGEQHWVLFRRGLEQVENMAPNQLHIVNVHYNAVLDWIAQFESAFVFFLENQLFRKFVTMLSPTYVS
jgi:hypothetical protein